MAVLVTNTSGGVFLCLFTIKRIRPMLRDARRRCEYHARMTSFDVPTDAAESHRLVSLVNFDSSIDFADG